jgi:uncharacterized protein
MSAVLPIPRPWISPADIRKKRHEQYEKNQEFYECINDILNHPVVLQMKKYYQHCETDCYEHCLNVAYNNFRICKHLGLDARSAARGGMLHDLFLYDWRKHSRRTGDHLHAITHPIAAYYNARKYFQLNKIEREVITKHMWPVSVIPPRYPETYIICLTDKYCGSMEIAEHYSGILKSKFWGRPIAWLMKKAFEKVPRADRIQELLPEIDSIDSAAKPLSFVQQRRRPRRSSSGWNHSPGRRHRVS